MSLACSGSRMTLVPEAAAARKSARAVMDLDPGRIAAVIIGSLDSSGLHWFPGLVRAPASTAGR